MLHFIIKTYIILQYMKKFVNQGDNMKILVTGGAGYIGSHTCVELLNAGY